jgi:DNA-binding transcriptional LysR family regulator
MDRLENRELEYFVTVAQELHFGRAAARLGISQPPLSRAISRLERRVGVPLLERTSRRVRLTPAGEVFFDESVKALAAVDLAIVNTRRAHSTTPLTVAARPGVGSGVLRTLLDAYEQLPSSRDVQVLFTNDQAGAVRDGCAQLALLCATNDLTGLSSLEVGHETSVALVAASHCLANRATVTLSELERETRFQAQCPAEPVDQLLDLVALGRLIMLAGQSAAERADDSVRGIPVSDVPDTTVVLAWPERELSPAASDFVDLASRLTARRSSRPAKV